MRFKLGSALVMGAVLSFCAQPGLRSEVPSSAPSEARHVTTLTFRNSALSRYLEMLAHPRKAWRYPASLDAQARNDVESMLKQYAPRIWFHLKERYRPMDPLEFIRQSSLRSRTSSGREQVIFPRGSVSAEKLAAVGGGDPAARPYQKGFAWNGSGFFLKYEGAQESAASGPVPVLWRIGQGALAQRLAADSQDRPRVLIEYWYHVPYNLATRIGIGNHQGDWEGVSMLVEFGMNKRHLEHRLLAAYFAEHETGSWVCGRDISRLDDGHPEAFSAIGTHATYATAGRHKSAILTDVTERGMRWDTWNVLRPLELEPYYGYSGAWGEPRMFSFMTGPLVPGPGYKWLPRDSAGAAERVNADLHSRCGI